MYGQVFENAATFVAGINENVFLKKFELVDVNTPKYTGKALDISYGKDDGSEISDRLFPVDESNITPYGDDTKEEAVEKAYAKMNSKIMHIVCNFTATEEQFRQAVKAATDFTSYVNICASLLPSDFSTKKGSLIIGYNKNGFLEVPKSLKVTGAFFSVDNKHKLQVNESRVKLTSPRSDSQEVTDTQNTNW